MAVNIDELKKAMDILGITDIHTDKEQAKKIYKKLLIKWHPDSCVNGDERYYNEVSSKINSAYETIEKAYEEGLMGPNAKKANEDSQLYNNKSYYKSDNTNSKSTYSYHKDNTDSKSTYSYHKDNTDSSNKDYKNQTFDNKRTSSSSQTYTSYDYFDSPDGWDIVYYRKRWLNFIFLTICTFYVINAIIKSPITDIYIEKSVINMISMIAIYYAVYWFCQCIAIDGGFVVSGIFAWLIYKAIKVSSMFIYNKIGDKFEWLAMLLFIVAFFVAEYFIHITKILITLDKKIKVKKYTKIFSYFMLFEYAIMFVFGIYSVILVHRFMAIRNVIIPSWY